MAEAGSAQPDGKMFYDAAGYRPVPNFGPYEEMQDFNVPRTIGHGAGVRACRQLPPPTGVECSDTAASAAQNDGDGAVDAFG